ncbi:MAG: hypothetical protein R3F56_26505 [Planctomycetota bacterium]
MWKPALARDRRAARTSGWPLPCWLGTVEPGGPGPARAPKGARGRPAPGRTHGGRTMRHLGWIVNELGSSAPRDGDLRLRELTEQTLRLLDQLAAARRQAQAAEAERRQWHLAHSRLEARLADLRARVRASSTAHLVLGALPEPAPDGCETFVCVDDSLDVQARDRWLSALRRCLERMPATLIVPAGQRPSEGVLAILSGIRVLESEGKRPAALWNLALATARAPMVLIIGPGAVPVSVRTSEIALFDVPDVAVVQPALRIGREGPHILGCQGDARLRLEPRRLSAESGDELEDLEFAHPALFAVRQQAVVDVGPFDQDLASDLALAEFCLRSRAGGLRVVGVPPLRGDLLRAHARRRPKPLERDHLVILARHRPSEVPAALAQSRDLWLAHDGERAEVIGALLRRLPGAAESPAALEAAEHGILAVARATVPWEVWRQHLDMVAEAMEIGIDVGTEGEQRGAASRAVEALVARGRVLVGWRDEAARASEVSDANADLREQLAAAQARVEAADRRERELSEACASLQHSLAVHDRLRVEAEEFGQAAATARDALAAELAAQRQAASLLRSALSGIVGLPNHAPDDQIVSRVTHVAHTLGERDAWLASLLREKAHRRVRLRPRLDDAERAFLARHSEPGGNAESG